MGPWSLTEPTHLPFATTVDKDEVCDLIRAAQLAILNPDKNHLDYIPGAHRKISTTQLVQFSPNAVKLEISERNWPNLSFIDLPGIIANTDKVEDNYLIDLVRNLSKLYAGDTNMVNILALTMTNDLANSLARRVIQEIHAESRTLEVFTKPDRISDVAQGEFMAKFVSQEACPIPDRSSAQHGHHIVMMQQDSQVSQVDARRLERQFFSETPWSLLKPQLQERLGVDALRDRIRVLLFEKTRETLPANLQSIEQRISNIKIELARFPPPPDISQLPEQLTRLLHNFNVASSKLFEGGGQDPTLSFRCNWMKQAERFFKQVAEAEPRLTLSSQVERAQRAALEATIERKKSKQGSNRMPALEISDDDDDVSQARQSPPLSRIKSEPVSDARSVQAPKILYRQFSLEAIRILNSGYDIEGLPRQAYPEAIKQMMRDSVECWGQPLNEFMQGTSRLVQKHVVTLVRKEFQAFSNYPLLGHIQLWVKQQLDTAVQEEWNNADAVCEVEKSYPFTMAKLAVSAKAEKCLQERLIKRKAYRQKIKQLEHEAEGKTSAAAAKLAKEDPDLDEDGYNLEVSMFSQVCAYYEVASLRFTDAICQRIVGRVFGKLSKDLARDLYDELGPNNEAKQPKLRELVAEDQEMERRRQKLIREQQRLIEGRDYIHNVLGVDSSSSGRNDDNNLLSTQTAAVTDRTRLSITPAPRTPVKRVASDDVEKDSTTKKVRHSTQNLKLSNS